MPQNAKALLLDDVLATGGTLVADILIRNAGFDVAGAITLLEISFLNGGYLLKQNNIRHLSVIKS